MFLGTLVSPSIPQFSPVGDGESDIEDDPPSVPTTPQLPQKKRYIRKSRMVVHDHDEPDTASVLANLRAESVADESDDESGDVSDGESDGSDREEDDSIEIGVSGDGMPPINKR